MTDSQNYCYWGQNNRFTSQIEAKPVLNIKIIIILKKIIKGLVMLNIVIGCNFWIEEYKLVWPYHLRVSKKLLVKERLKMSFPFFFLLY